MRPISPAARVATVAQTCEMLSISHPTVYRLLKAGQLSSIHIGRSRLITIDSINELLGEANRS
jgi:excisionase family DNA binding protein